MREDIFDTYLRSILDKSNVKSEGSTNPPASETPAPAPVITEEPTPEVEENTINFDGGTKRLDSTPPTPPQPIRVVRKKKKKVRKANYSAYGGIVLATLVLCSSVIISLFVIVVGRDFLGIETNDNVFTLYIEENWTVSDIAQYLYDNGIIQYPELFRQYAKLRIGDGSVYPGDLDVMPATSYSELIDSLTEIRAAHPTVSVTFPEGSTVDDCAKILEEAGVCNAEDFIFAFNSNAYGFDFESHVGSSGLKYHKYEGYLFPDTYEFYTSDPENDFEGDSVYNIVKKIKTRTDEIMNADFIKRCQDSGRTLEEVVTMASILQLESGKAEEMPKIASVFYNRLANPSVYPHLQTDTSKKYIAVIKAGSTMDFQEMYDAYDTYVCSGLPVGPICNPGQAALEAALSPADSSYYFFCSSPETGEFYYAETYAEHEENIKLAGLEV